MAGDDSRLIKLVQFARCPAAERKVFRCSGLGMKEGSASDQVCVVAMIWNGFSCASIQDASCLSPFADVARSWSRKSTATLG